MLNADDSQSDSTEPEEIIENSLPESTNLNDSMTLIIPTTINDKVEMTQERLEDHPSKRICPEMTNNLIVNPSTTDETRNHSILPRGLQNLGNTCFMNSALQCICRSPTIREYFLKDENVVTQGFSSKFGHLVREVNTNSMLAFSPWSFKHAISEKDARFGGYEQQDAQELAILLLDAIHEDQKRLEKTKLSEISLSDSPIDNLNDISKKNVDLEEMIPDDSKLDEWEKYLRKEDTIISRNFHGLFRSVIKCGACKKESVAFDPFASLSLSISTPPRESFKVFRNSGDVLVQSVTKTSEDWLFKDGFYYESIPDSSFYSFYAECDQSEVAILVDPEESGEALKICKVSRPFLLPTATPLEFLRTRLEAVYPDVELDWSRSLISHEEKFIFKKDLMTQLCSDGDALKDIKEFFDTLFKETQCNEEYDHQQSTSLDECLSAFEKAESLTSNTWYCPNCKTRPDSASKQMNLHVLPPLLLIQLKRFEFNSWGGSRKLTRLVTYPEVLKIDNESYDLYGIVEHFGSLFSGHYTARVKCDNKWYNFDDSYVSHVSNAINSRNAYLLFYSRSN